MATTDSIATVDQQAPQGERAQRGGGMHLARMLGAIVDLAYSINEQANVALNGNAVDSDGLLRGMQQLARQVGYLASCGQQELGAFGAETDPMEWLCPGR